MLNRVLGLRQLRMQLSHGSSWVDLLVSGDNCADISKHDYHHVLTSTSMMIIMDSVRIQISGKRGKD